MAELSATNLVLIDIDPDSGDPTGLKVGIVGDTIVSSILPINSREAIQRVEDSSSTWDAGSDPSAAGFENWNDTSTVVAASSNEWNQALNRVTDSSAAWDEGGDPSAAGFENWNSTSATLNTFSGSVETSTADLDTSTHALNVFSGSVDTSVVTLDTNITAIDTRVGDVESQVPSAVGFSDWDRTRDYVTAASAGLDDVLDTSADWDEARTTISTFSGNMETSTAGLSALVDASTAILDTSTDALNVFSGSVETSTTTLDGRVVTVEAQVPSAVGFSDWDRTRDYVTQASTTIGNTSTFVFDGSGDLVNASSVFEGFSSTVEASVVTIDTNIATNTTNVATNAAGVAVNVGDIAYGNLRINDLASASGGYDDAATWANVSSTKSLGGTAPAATVSAITVSSCPLPGAWAYLRVTAAGTDSEQTDYFIGSGVEGSPSYPTVAVTEIDSTLIAWNGTSPYFDIVNAGYYHVSVQASFLVDSSPTNVTLTLATSTGAPGWVDTDLNSRLQVIRQNIDPQDQVIEWMGYLTAGTKLLCHVEVSGSDSAASRVGTSFSVRRIN